MQAVTGNSAYAAASSTNQYPAVAGVAYGYNAGNNLTTDPYLCQVFAGLLVAREDMSRAEQIEAERKQTIQQRMGEASKVIFPMGVVSWKKSKAGSGRFLVHA